MSSAIIDQLRHPKEVAYGSIMSIVGGIIWGLFGLFMLALLFNEPSAFFIYIVYALGFALAIFISAAFFRAYIYGHYVLIGPSQFPTLNQMIEDGAVQLGLSPAPRAFVYNSNGIMNAFARKLLGRRYVFLTSAIIQAETDAQVKFVVGHELGHHAAGHLDWSKNLIKLPGHAVPFLGPAYSRGRELTCDRVGAHISGDFNASRSALQMLACGCARLNSAMNCEAFEAQEQQVPALTGWLLLIFAHYPRTTQRVLAVSEFFKTHRGTQY